MLADTAEIHAFGAAASRHAADLSSLAAELASARVSADEFGAVGAAFAAALNDALAQEVHRARVLAERLGAATATAGSAADAYRVAEHHAEQAITALGT